MTSYNNERSPSIFNIDSLAWLGSVGQCYLDLAALDLTRIQTPCSQVGTGVASLARLRRRGVTGPDKCVPGGQLKECKATGLAIPCHDSAKTVFFTTTDAFQIILMYDES